MDIQRARRGSGVRTPVLAALCTAMAVAGGAFDLRARVVAVAVAVAAAAVTVRAGSRQPPAGLWAAPVLLALPMILSAATADTPGAAIPEALTLALVVAVAMSAREVPLLRAIELCASIGAALTVLGIVGIVARIEPLGIEASPWRIGGGIGYQNAAGTILGIAFVCSLLLAHARPGAQARVLAVLCGIGLLGTMSRGAILATTVAVVALAAQRAPIDLRPAAWAAAGAVGLAPAMMEAPGGGIIAAVGITLAAAAATRTIRVHRVIALLAVIALTVGVFVGAATALGTREGTTSNQRLAVWGATLDAMDHDVLLGTGPGTYNLVRVRDGKVVTSRHAHNDYIETLSEQGVIGLACLLVAAALVFRRASRLGEGPARGVATGVLILIATHASLDFITQIPAVVAFAAVPVAAAFGHVPTEEL